MLTNNIAQLNAFDVLHRKVIKNYRVDQCGKSVENSELKSKSNRKQEKVFVCSENFQSFQETFAVVLNYKVAFESFVIRRRMFRCLNFKGNGDEKWQQCRNNSNDKHEALQVLRSVSDILRTVYCHQRNKVENNSTVVAENAQARNNPFLVLWKPSWKLWWDGRKEDVWDGTKRLNNENESKLVRNNSEIFEPWRRCQT